MTAPRRVRRDAGTVMLATGVLAAANAANAYRPVSRHGRPSVASWVAGWFTSDLPLLALGTTAAITAAAVRSGALRTPRGRAGAALALGAMAGHAGLEVIARRSEPVAWEALDAALPPGWRDRVVRPAFPPDEVRDRTGVARTLLVRRRFVHDGDIPYGPAGARNHLDVWRRDDLPRDARAPVLLQVPGGAWVYGNKQAQAYPLMSHLAARGWICVAMSYRLSPRATWPDQIVDVKRALAWIREHIAEYGGDRAFVCITGGSAGGHLSSLAALTANDPAWQPGFEDVDTGVRAAVPFYGVYDWTNRDDLGNRGLLPLLERRVVKRRLREARDVFERASPMSRLHDAAPPFFILHGRTDSLVPVEQARRFVAELRAVATEPVAYAEFPYAQHAFDILGAPRATAVARAVAAFLGWVYGGYRAEVEANR